MTALNASLGGRLDAMQLARPVELSGRVTRHDGHLLACDGFPVSVGAVCAIETDTGAPALAEIIGFDGGQNLMSLYDTNARVRLGARVSLRDEGRDIQVGPKYWVVLWMRWAARWITDLAAHGRSLAVERQGNQSSGARPGCHPTGCGRARYK